MRYVNYIVLYCVLCVVFCLIPMAVLAGSLNSPAGTDSADSAMYTIEDIYNRLNAGTAGARRTGPFTEPSAGPTAGAGHTLNDVMGKAPSVDDTNGAGAGDVADGKKFWGLTSGAWGMQTGTSEDGGGSTCAAGVAKTGQTPTVPFSAPEGSDGGLQKGVAWPNPRFTDNGNGTVTDNLTGLIWLKNASCDGTKTWAAALTYCNNLAHGTCDLTDSSEAGDWRLPNIKELLSLIDWAYANPPLSNDAGTGKWADDTSSAFTGVQSNYYWSSTTCADITGYAWYVNLSRGGTVYYDDKGNGCNDVWPVRGGQ